MTQETLNQDFLTPNNEQNHIIDKDNFLNIFNQAIIRIFRDALGFSKEERKYTKFFFHAIRNQRKAKKKRERYLEKGIHVPAFLIFSVTHRCNLQCKGCYSHAFHENPQLNSEMDTEMMKSVITQAREMGTSIVLIAGGEPFTRSDIIAVMGAFPDIIFPVFTNGSLLTESLITQLKKYPNIIPILSIEGKQAETDHRRGHGVYGRLLKSMQKLKQNNVYYGTSITLTRKNFDLVTDQEFVEEIVDFGCKIIFYIDYVPVQPNSEDLILTRQQALSVSKLTDMYRTKYERIFLGFPGDEEKMGGCLSSGRGFLHISPEGRIEPCPFAPYSDCNLHEISFKQALQSPLLREIRKHHDKLTETQGGCALWENREWLQSLL